MFPTVCLIKFGSNNKAHLDQIVQNLKLLLAELALLPHTANDTLHLIVFQRLNHSQSVLKTKILDSLICERQPEAPVRGS